MAIGTPGLNYGMTYEDPKRRGSPNYGGVPTGATQPTLQPNPSGYTLSRGRPNTSYIPPTGAPIGLPATTIVPPQQPQMTLAKAPGPATGESFTPAPAAPMTLAPMPGPATGVTTTPPGPNVGQYTTDAGRIVAERALNYLQGNDPQIKAAENRQQRDEARRLYAARIAAEEAMGQTHFQPGTAQYQRALDRSRAGAEAGNIDAREAFNAFVRGRTQDVENLASGMEQEQYERGQTTKKDTEARWTELLNALPDGPARYAALQMRNGGSSIADVTAALFEGGTGTIRGQYRTPTDTAAQRKTIEEQMPYTNPDLKPGTPEYNAEVAKKLKTWIETETAPTGDADKERKINDARELLTKGTLTDPAARDLLVGSGDIPNFGSPGDVKNHEQIRNAKMIKIGDQYYKVGITDNITTNWQSHGLLPDERDATTYTALIDDNGRPVYLYNGKINSKPPKKDNSPY